MTFAVLVYTKPGTYEALDEAERQSVSREYMEIREAPGCVGGAQLAPVETATTIRIQDGETLITDGPFANTKEVFGGYYLFEADDLDTVLEIAKRCPTVRLGGSVEVRPVVPVPAAAEAAA
jgi:hypothetical protein